MEITSFHISYCSEKTDSLKILINSAKDNEKAKLYLALSVAYFNKDSLNLSLEHARNAEEIALMLQDEIIMNNINNQLGYIFLSWDDYEKAMKYFMKSLSGSQKLNDENSILGAYHGLGRTYTRLKEFDLARESLENALRFAERGDMTRGKAIMNNALGNLYQELKNYEKALEHFNMFYVLAQEIGDETSVAYGLNNLGQVYNLLGDYNKASYYLKLALKQSTEINNAQAQAASLGNLGEVYSKLGNYDLAISYINKSIEISKKQGFRLFTSDNYRLLSETYSRMGDFKQALENYIKYNNLNDSIFSDEKQAQIHKLKLRFEKEQSERKIKLLEQESRNRGIFLRFSIAASILGLIIILLLINSFRLRVKLHKQEKDKLDDTINQRNRELVTLRMDSEQKRQFLNEIESSVEKFDEDEKREINDFVDRLKSKLKSGKVPEKEWNLLKVHFEDVHPDFFKKLLLKHPSLTQYDLKICAYIKINLTTKDIARMLNISNRSVQTARYRIKKKIELPSDYNLFKYIQQF
ncbi:tetratricopeptide repeat protein [candidate division KSB1 bacterium]